MTCKRWWSTTRCGWLRPSTLDSTARILKSGSRPRLKSHVHPSFPTLIKQVRTGGAADLGVNSETVRSHDVTYHGRRGASLVPETFFARECGQPNRQPSG